MKTAGNGRTLRIFHGPENIGGIGRFIADWERKQGAQSDFVVYKDNPYVQNSHINLHIEQVSWPVGLVRKLALLARCLFQYDLFHFYFGKTILPLNLDLPLLKLFGKKMLMTYAGTDIRLYEVEVKRNPYHQLRSVGANHPNHDWRKKARMFWHNLWIDRFIAVRNLYASVTRVIPARKVINDVWVINTVDISSYTPVYIPCDVPTIVHAATHPHNKGTAVIDQVTGELEQAGYRFNYIHIEKLPHDELEKICQNADIVIDQLYSGGFGNFAMEGMFYGKPVCGYVIDEIRSQLPDLPIVECRVETLKDQLAWLIEHPEERIRLGKAGRAFAEKHYDREKTCQRLWQVYQEVLHP